jgi:hypothetical protein
VGEVRTRGGAGPPGVASASGAPARLRPPSWRDTRLVVGVLIVLGSVALGARVIAAADRTVPTYAAATTLVAGRPLSDADLRVVRVHLDGSVAAYLGPRATLPPDATVLRTIRAGELVPESAVGPGSSGGARPVSIPIEGTLPAQLRPGSWVDVWSSARDPAAAQTSYRPPVLLARAAEVATVTSAATGLTLSQGASVQVLLGDPALRAVLDALANGARLALIPAPAPQPVPAPAPAQSAGSSG